MLFNTHRSSISLAAVVGGLVALTIASCSGGSTTTSTPGAIDALSVADQMSVVTTGGGSGASVVPHSQADTSSFSATCDYNTDVANAHVFDPSMESLQTVNMILCLLKQTAYASLLNEGVYKAQIDENSCNKGGNDNSTGQSSGTQQSFNIWVVESSRASNTGAQTVEFWIPNQDDQSNGEIRVRMTITAGASDTNPFGVFDLNFIQYDSTGESITGLGNLHTLDVLEGFIGFSFYQENGDINAVQAQGDHAETIQANVNMFADQSQGVAHILNRRRENFSGTDTGIQETEYALAFDDTHVLRSADNDAGTCLSRTNFQKRTWGYNLYDATTGARVELNSGFGFQTEAGAYGWIGYYGLWAPPNVSLATGDTVTRNTYGQGTAQSYTVLKAPGKLIKNSRHTLSLTALGNTTFEWYTFGIGGPQQFHVQYTAPNWLKTGVWNPNSQSYDTLGEPEIIDVEAVGFLSMFSQELGGQVSYAFGQESITYFSREFVTPTSDIFVDASNVELYGYFNCLRTGITSEEATSGNVYEENSYAYELPYEYRIHKADMSFTHVTGGGQTVVGLADGAAPTSGPFMWGMNSGPLVTIDVLDNMTSPQELWNAPVFYTYETGANPWNQFVTLIDTNGASVVFDPPLQFSYTHTTADDANADSANDGRVCLLNYNGPGNLGGIPNIEVDFNNDGQTDRWLPAFSIADGTLCGPTGTEYVLRAINSELSLGAAPGGCSLLTVGPVYALALPTVADWTDPAMGTAPTVDSAPRVIEGVEVQSGS